MCVCVCGRPVSGGRHGARCDVVMGAGSHQETDGQDDRRLTDRVAEGLQRGNRTEPGVATRGGAMTTEMITTTIISPDV